MEKRRLSLFLLLCLLPTACGPAAQPEQAPVPEPPAPEVTEPAAAEPEPDPAPELSQREKDWIEDIEFLREEFKAEHPDPFFVCSEEEFDWKLDQLEAKVGQLSDTDIYYEITAIIAGMGDNHTSIRPSDDPADRIYDSIYGRLFPIRACYIGDKLYLCGYLEGYDQFSSCLLHEIVAVNGIDIAYLKQKMEDITNPYNSWLAEELLYNCFLPSFFDWAGCDYKEGYTFQILNDNQEVESIEVPTVTSEAAAGSAWIFPEGWDRLFRGGYWAEFVEGENGGCIRMHFARLKYVPDVTELFHAAATLIEGHPDCSKLVIDLRDLSGGEAARLALIRECAEKLDISPIKRTYVVTGGYTQSAAIGCISVFQDVLDAVVIGEPTGQFASCFCFRTAFKQPFAVPHSRIICLVPDDWWESEIDCEAYYDEDGRPYPWENTILPDVYVHQDIEDIRQGRDSVLQWVLAQEK